MPTYRYQPLASAPKSALTDGIDYRRKLLRAVNDLPPLPTVLNQLLRMLNDSNCTSSQIAAMIEKDSVLSGSVLRCVNSAYYGLATRVSSIRHSVTLLGFTTVRNLALAFSMRQMLSKPRAAASEAFTQYSQHALGAAIMTQFLAHYTRSTDLEGAFAVGLFHDIGKLLIITTLPDVLPALVAHWAEGEGDFEESEAELIGVRHSELSGIVLERWKLPQPIQAAVRYHHNPSACPSEPDQPITLAHLVHAADVYVKSYGLEVLPSPNRPPESPERAFDQIGLREHLPELLERFKVEFQSIRDVFE